MISVFSDVASGMDDDHDKNLLLEKCGKHDPRLCAEKFRHIHWAQAHR